MTLVEFCAELRQEIMDFKVQWEEDAAGEPGNFPMDMEPAEWHEQFMTYTTTP
jgi:hypothetical protein